MLLGHIPAGVEESAEPGKELIRRIITTFIHLDNVRDLLLVVRAVCRSIDAKSPKKCFGGDVDQDITQVKDYERWFERSHLLFSPSRIQCLHHR